MPGLKTPSSFLGPGLALLSCVWPAHGRDVSLNFYTDTGCRTVSALTPSAALNLSTCVVTPGLVSLHYETVGCAGGGIVVPYLFKDAACGSKLSSVDYYTAGRGCLSGFASSTVAAIMLSCNQDRPEQPQATTTVSVNQVATGGPPASTGPPAGPSGSGGKSNNDPTKTGWASLSQGTRTAIYIAAGAIVLFLSAAVCWRWWRKSNHSQMFDQREVINHAPYWNNSLQKVPGTTTLQVTSPTSSHRAHSSPHYQMEFHSTPTVATGAARNSAPDADPPLASRPESRDGFTIAIFCALVLEADAIKALFDRQWDGDGSGSFSKEARDDNTYSTGAIGRFNVVLVHMAGMGKINANTAAKHCKMSFPNIQLALVVGVCGVVPFYAQNKEIVLGDVVISEGVVQHDFGWRLPHGFAHKTTTPEALGPPAEPVRTLLAKLQGLQTGDHLTKAMAEHLVTLRKEPRLKAGYPGREHDVLFAATDHYARDQASCKEAGCHGTLQRERLKDGGREDLPPAVHFGLVASGDSVIKSGVDRDRIAAEAGVIAFEMEGAGIWGTFPCIIVKGACDYADSHKGKSWQRYAAATAAACAKALLEHRDT